MNTRSTFLRSLVASAAVVSAFVATSASADPAITTQGVNVRAGPDVSYPQVGYLGPGMNVNVVGCVEGWQWCDVVAGPNRGWVYAGYLSYAYYDRPTIISYGGPSLGIPLISFSIGNYWDNYYRGRPFWNNRAYWYNHRVARAPEWHAPSNWQGNDGRGHDYGRGNDGRGHDNNGWRGHDNRAHDNRGNDNRGDDWRGNSDRRAASDHHQVPQSSGSHGSLGPQDNFHAEQQ
jgi:uncharacterized protein YraI